MSGSAINTLISLLILCRGLNDVRIISLRLLRARCQVARNNGIMFCLLAQFDKLRLYTMKVITSILDVY